MILALTAWCLAPIEGERTARATELAERIEDWEETFRRATVRFSSPLLWVGLRRAGIESRLPERVGERFAELYHQTALTNAVRLKRMLEVSTALGERGIAVLYLKGASLLLRGVYPDFGCRIMSDVDVLARAEDRKEIEETFRQIGGWKHYGEHVMPGCVVSEWWDDFGSQVEVHWSLKPNNGAEPGRAEARLWADAQEVQSRWGRALVPSLEDCLIQAALHSTAHHSFDTAYLFPGSADLAHLLWKERRWDWERIRSSLAAERMLEHAAVAVGVAHELTGLPQLGQALSELCREGGKWVPAAGALIRSLARLACQPWVMQNFHERRLLARKSWREWVHYFYYGAARRVRRRARKGEGGGLPGRGFGPVYERRLGEPAFWRHLWALYRFDRKINFQCELSAGDSLHVAGKDFADENNGAE